LTEKRVGARLRRRLVVTVDTHPWFTTDLGAGGFGAEASVLPARGARVVGIIRSGELEIPFSGRVVWTTRGNMNMGQRSRAGVRFLRVGDSLGKLIDPAVADPLAAPHLVPRPLIRRGHALEASGPGEPCR
jgi:hypothetical protein